ncbi:MAG: substrate-binding domain-containing protein [Alphaproteobacteria bacterium]|nr:substrate-binding domain-containing protein [Alphaproteobacteria bacterium]
MRSVKRFVRVFGLAVAAAGLWCGLAQAAEVRLEMKGGGFEITGELKVYDGKKYIVESPIFGMMTVDGARFECVSQNCPTRPTIDPDFVGGGRAAAPVGDLGTTSWMGGSGIGTNFMPELVKSYAASRGLTVQQTIGTDNRDLIFNLEDNTGKKVGTFNVLRHGVSEAYKDLIDGKVELVWTSARMTDAQQATFTAAGAGGMRVEGNEHVFALDSMVALVSQDNPAVSISVDNLAGIYSGRITDWAQLGLPGGKINVYAPVEGMGMLMHFKNTILTPRGLSLMADAIRLGTVVEWSDKVAADPNGISFNFIGYIRNAKALNIATECGLITRPTYFSAKTEEFPLSRRLYFYTRGQPKSVLGRELLTHALSPEIQSVLKAANFVDQEPELLSFKEQGARIAYALNAADEDFDIEAMRGLIKDVAAADRLSTTLRFEIGSFALDTKALQDVQRLAQLLQRPEFQSRKVMLLGFADAVGAYEPNLRLSEARAIAVEAALRRAGYSGAITKGYSELAPVACNDTPERRELNRRVEVWIQ